MRTWLNNTRIQRITAACAIALSCALLTSPAHGQIDLRLHAQDDLELLRLIDQPRPLFTPEQLRDTPIDSDIIEIVARLDSSDYSDREAAMAELATSDDDRRLQLYALLARNTLSAEQRYRILQAVREQLINTPRGALGVSMQPFLAARGGPLEIVINDLIPGLPAERILQVGDRITAIDDKPLLMDDDLPSRVQSKKPGESVRVTVKRARLNEQGAKIRDDLGEPVFDVLNFDIPLGSTDLLDEQPNRNAVLRPSRVLTARRIEADAVMYAYAPQPRVIVIKGGASQMSRGEAIDEHSAIANLIIQKQISANRSPEQLQAMREYWERELRALVELSNRPGLGEDERAHLRRVAARFLEIMNADS